MKSRLDGSLTSSLQFALEVIYIIAMSIPIGLISIFKKFVPGEGKNLRNKIVLVTGAGNGLGRELSLQLATKHGCRVVCVDIRKADNEQTVKDIQEVTGDRNRARGYICDVSNTASVEELRKNVLADFEKVDVLINNAGIIYANSMLTGTEEHIRRVIDINFLGTYWVTRAFLASMKERNDGHVVFINSMSALTPVGNASVYSSTKAGLLGTALALDDELRQDKSNIKVTSVHPYFIATSDMYSKKFQTRLAAMTVSEAAQGIITGVRREYLTFQVPGNELGFTLSSLLTLLPTNLYHIARDVFSADLNQEKKTENIVNIPSKVIEDCASYKEIQVEYEKKTNST